MAGSGDSAPAAPGTASSLLSLPPELRNRVYCHVLISEPLFANRNSISSRIAILQTCKQTEDEATGIFYTENEFSIRLDGQGYSPKLRSIGLHAFLTTNSGCSHDCLSISSSLCSACLAYPIATS